MVGHLARSKSFRALLVAVPLCLAPERVGAAEVEDLAFVDGLNGWHLWAFYVGNSSYWGGPAGEWSALVDGRPELGYFCHPWSQWMTSGSYVELASVTRAAEAAWLVDQYAVGLGRDWLPPGFSGYTETDARAGLAFAVYEVAMSPEDEPFDLFSGRFRIWMAPAPALELGQAYLDELTEATLDVEDLERRYGVFIGDQWTGYGYAHWVVPHFPQDINDDGKVDMLDLLAVLAAWGESGGPADVNGDGIVDLSDLLQVLSAWGG